ncbi:MAG TPA: FAD-dependent oxidoreductase [Candidatus Limnocylindria bacterium]|nr:FAD-dependent oxidoreductase [Candidatus Limnocylindria bacterium]
MAVEHTARVEDIVEYGPETRGLWLRLATPLAFLPGQFLSCLLPVGGTTLTRPYSIASDPESTERVEIVVDLVPNGPGSHHLFSLVAGDTVRYTGPWGTFALEEAPSSETIFIADGTGIAPIRPMLRRALATAVRPVTLLYGHRAGAPLLFADELAAPHPGYTMHVVPSAALLEETRRRWVDGDTDRTRHFFICGVGAIVHELRDLLRGAGYARQAVRYEKW